MRKLPGSPASRARRAEANGSGEVAAEFLGDARTGIESLDQTAAERWAAAPLPKSQGTAKPAAS